MGHGFGGSNAWELSAWRRDKLRVISHLKQSCRPLLILLSSQLDMTFFAIGEIVESSGQYHRFVDRWFSLEIHGMTCVSSGWMLSGRTLQRALSIVYKFFTIGLAPAGPATFSSPAAPLVKWGGGYCRARHRPPLIGSPTGKAQTRVLSISLSLLSD